MNILQYKYLRIILQTALKYIPPLVILIFHTKTLIFPVIGYQSPWLLIISYNNHHLHSHNRNWLIIICYSDVSIV